MGYKLYRNRTRARADMEESLRGVYQAIDDFGDHDPNEWGPPERRALTTAFFRLRDALNKMRYYATTLEPTSDAE